MKQRVVIVLAAIGALTLVILGGCGLSHLVLGPAGYDEVAREQFGSTPALADLYSLYARAESSTGKSELKVVSGGSRTGTTTRRIPRSWLPERFSDIWGHSVDEPGIELGDVLAYYDSSDFLIAVEFCGSRYGCYLSRRAEQLPSDFETLVRLSEKPLYATAIVIGEREPGPQ